MRTWVMAATLLAGMPLAAAENCVLPDAKMVSSLFDEWNFSLSSLDANQVTQRYWPNAVLLPTASNTPRTSAAMINDYFVHFLAKRPRGRIDTRTIQVGCNLAMDMGTYTFSLMDDKGVTSDVAARYTFVYQYRDGGWKILHHHSSAMPESAGGAEAAELHASAKPAVAAPKPVLAEAPQPAPRPARAEPPKAMPPATPAKVVKVVPKPEPPKADAPKGEAPKAELAKTEVAKPEPAKPEPAKPEPPKQSARPAEAPVRSSTSMFANLTASPPPSKFYPAEAAKRKEHGNVNLRVCADGAGAVSGTPEVLKSSGSKLLDEAAQSWARAVKWVPATLNNHAVEGCAQVDVAFEATA